MEARYKFECSCGQHLVARESMAGTKVHCPVCRQAVTIPPPDEAEAVDEAQYETTERYAVVCTCGHQMLVKVAAAGHTIHCANCGKRIQLPSVEQLRGKTTPTLQAKDFGGDELTTTDLFLLVDDEEGPGTDIM